MENWVFVTSLLTAFGFFKEFRPSEPFVTDYLTDYKNYTEDQVIHVAYPIGTYTYLATLPAVFLVTDFIRYKKVIIFEGLCFVACYIILIWGTGMISLVAVQLLYGTASSTEVAYYTYIYAKVDKKKYKKVTSLTYTAILLGNFAAAGLSQVFYSSGLLDFQELHYLTLASVSISLVLSFLLPPPKNSIYFHREIPGENGQGKLPLRKRVKDALPIIWKDYKDAYTNNYVVKWSIWWAISSAGFLQVINYTQALWRQIKTEDETILNGAVDATHTILSAILALAFGYKSFPWYKYSEWILGFISLIQGGILILMSRTNSLNVAYVSYITFRTFYQVMITVATAEVTERISEDSYGLIFGSNRFLALSLQTILTLVVADQNGLALDERTQFTVYGSYFGVLGIIFILSSLYTLIKNKFKNESNLTPIIENKIS